MLAASWPVAASRSERRSSASMRTTSVTSWKITTQPPEPPSAERRTPPESPRRRSWPARSRKTMRARGRPARARRRHHDLPRAGQHLLDVEAQHVPRGAARDALRLRVERGDAGPRGPWSSRPLVRLSTVRSWRSRSSRRLLALGSSRSPGDAELPGERGAEQRHEQQRRRVHHPERRERRARQRPAEERARARALRGPERQAVARGREHGRAVGAAALEQDRAVQRDREVEEAEEAVRAAGEVHQRRDQRHVDGELQRAEARQPPHEAAAPRRTPPSAGSPRASTA